MRSRESVALEMRADGSTLKEIGGRFGASPRRTLGRGQRASYACRSLLWRRPISRRVFPLR